MRANRRHDVRPGKWRVCSIVQTQPHAAMNGVADRLRSQGAVDEKVGGPAFGDAVSDPAAIFEPVLVADGRYDLSVAGDGRDETGMVRKRLHEAAVDVALDIGAEQVRQLRADLGEICSIGARSDARVKRIERSARLAVTVDVLPELPDLDRGGQFVARR